MKKDRPSRPRLSASFGFSFDDETGESQFVSKVMGNQTIHDSRLDPALKPQKTELKIVDCDHEGQ